ncbi:histidinol-phosphatase [Microbaculum marinum]|uniref:Histidinol-phosphatase n=1 Tax=Microbaculum marinum TaxID=1764581 RepID=A0AAW9RJD2_9HYPH
MTRDETEAFAHRLADAAAAATLPHFRSALSVENKLDDAFDPVTVADRAAEQAIRALVFATYPDHGLHGEEFGVVSGTGEYEWVIDPIDGTRSFVSGVPLWTTIIGLRHTGSPVFGLVDQPYVGDRFWGGGGRARAIHRDGPARDIRTRACTDLSQATLMTTAPSALSGPGELDRYQQVEAVVRLARYGGDGYAYCLLAAGQIDLVIESGLQPYDVVGLIPIIEAAGGVVTSWAGDSANEGGTVIAAGDRRVHEAALRLLNA